MVRREARSNYDSFAKCLLEELIIILYDNFIDSISQFVQITIDSDLLNINQQIVCSLQFVV